MNPPTRPRTTDEDASTEPRLDWLASRRFRRTVLAVAGLLLLLVSAQTLRILARQAAPQEISLYGRWNLTPGSPSPYRVFVRDAREGRPVAGADVEFRLVDSDGEAVWHERTKTDDQGFAVAEANLADEAAEGAYTLAVRTASDHGENELAREVDVERSFRVLVSTDKPLYQPGQTIHVRTLSLATADLRPVAGRDVVVEVRDANGNKVFKKRLATSEYGLASADFQLADQVVTGSYTVSALLGDTTSERTVTVEHYRLPKFSIDLSTDASYFAPGDVVRGQVRARYTFGEPVVGGRVEVVVFELVESFRAFATLEGRTDDEGRFDFELALKDHFVGQPLEEGDALLSFEATVTDRASHRQTRTLERTVTNRPIRIDIVPESGTLVPGLANRVYVVTSYPDGTPARTTVDVEPPGTRIETDDAGLATVELVPRTGTITVTAEDERGVRVQARRDLELDAQAGTILLRTDRAVYRTGETANVTVLAGTAGRVFLDVVKDGRTVLTQTVLTQAVLTQALDVDGGRGELALDLPADLFGTLEIHAYRILTDGPSTPVHLRGNLVRDTRIVQVLRASDLEIRVELDQETYRPGEMAVLDFFVTREEGGAVPAALSLSGVDEAVFALQEMRPGLERVYFALLEELLEPRWEIHGHLPVLPRDAFDSSPPPADATAVAFSAARDPDGPGAEHTTGYSERQAELEHGKREHLHGLAASAALLPMLFAGLLVLPILFYGLLRIGRAAGEPSPEASREIRSLGIRWSLGFIVPVLAGFGAVVAGLASRHLSPDSAMFTAFGLTTLIFLVLLTLSVSRIGQEKTFRRRPLLRAFVKRLPFAYALGILGLFGLVAAVDTAEIVEEIALALLLVTFLLWLAASGALAVVARSLAESFSPARGVWIFFRRRSSSGAWSWTPCRSESSWASSPPTPW